MELWTSAHEWLTACGQKVDRTYCKEELTSHPDYPALTALVDFLDKGGMSYSAIQTDASHLKDLTYPLLAHIATPGQVHMQLIDTPDRWEIPYPLLQQWSGAIIQPREGTVWSNVQHADYMRRKRRNQYFVTAWAIISLTLYLLSVYHLPNPYLNIFGFLSLAGLFTSLLLVSTELGFTSQIVKQVCGSISPGGCETVLKGQYAKGIAGVTLADASLAYFFVQFTLYLLGCFYSWLLAGIVIPAFSGALISAVSIYLQAQKIRKWCALCLGVVSVLLVQNALAFGLTSFLPPGPGLIAWPLLLAISLMIELPIKELVKSNMQARLQLSKFKKWRLDPELFFYQWKNQPAIDHHIWTSDLVLGNPKATIQLTVACNPYCGPCASAHQQIDELLNKHGDKVAVQMRFLSFGVEEEGNRYAAAVAAILRKATTINNNHDLQTMLSDWFHWMDFDRWNAKWNAPKDIVVKERLTMHADWIQQSRVQFTPTIFLNGKKLPEKYGFEDLEQLLPELLESLEMQTA
jgi:uncharacterized membrane protein/thiol-disulfide isomerase/thioredoxin